MRFQTGAKAMVLAVSLCGRLIASAQYSAPATPAPYNPIALAEVTGAPRAAVQARQDNFQTLWQNPYLGGIPKGQISAAPLELSPKTRSRWGSSKISVECWPRMP